MKFTKLCSLVKEYRSATLLDEYAGELISRQHIVVRGAIFPLDGFPVVDKEALLTMMDVPKDKHAEFFIQQSEHTEKMLQYTQDIAEQEQAALMLGITIGFEQMVLNVLEAEDGAVYFVNNDYRKVIGGENGVDWWVRDLGSGKVIVAKRGYQNVGCMSAETMWANELKTDTLSEIASEARRLYTAAKEAELKKDGQQQTM